MDVHLHYCGLTASLLLEAAAEAVTCCFKETLVCQRLGYSAGKSQSLFCIQLLLPGGILFDLYDYMSAGGRQKEKKKKKKMEHEYRAWNNFRTLILGIGIAVHHITITFSSVRLLPPGCMASHQDTTVV